MDIPSTSTEPVFKYKNYHHRFSKQFLDWHVCKCHYPSNKIARLSIKES